MPLREDLQQNTVNGSPPWFYPRRPGGEPTPGQLPEPGPTNGSGYLALPAAELPQTVNPKNGFVVNANNDTSGATLDNDPLNQLRVGGQGIYYLGYSFDFGTRAGRITEALSEIRARPRRSQRHESHPGRRDAARRRGVHALHPEVRFANASQPGAAAALAGVAADGRVAEAVGR